MTKAAMDCVENGIRPKALVLKWGAHKHRVIINAAADRPLLPAMGQQPPSTAVAPYASASGCALPWNLRARNRTVAQLPKKKVEEVVEIKAAAAEQKMNLRSKTAKKVKEAPLKMAVALSKSEIEEDFLKMTGKKPPSRPIKRPKSSLNQHINDNQYPGLSLTSISRNSYHVPEPTPCTKKVNGLKGLMMEDEQ